MPESPSPFLPDQQDFTPSDSSSDHESPSPPVDTLEPLAPPQTVEHATATPEHIAPQIEQEVPKTRAQVIAELGAVTGIDTSNVSRMFIQDRDYYSGLQGALEKVQAGELDTSDERIVSALLGIVGHFNKGLLSNQEIEFLAEAGIPLERIAQDERLATATINTLIQTMDAQLARNANPEAPGVPYEVASHYTNYFDLNLSFPFNANYAELLTVVLQNPDYRQQIEEAVSIQAYGDIAMRASASDLTISRINDDGSPNQLLQTVARNVSLLKRLGYEPLINEDLEFFLRGGLEKQQNLSAIGLIEPQIVDKLYEFKWQKMKEWVKQGGPQGDGIRYFPPVLSSLQPSEGNEFATYWRAQTNGLRRPITDFSDQGMQDEDPLDQGPDAMEFVMEDLAKHEYREYIFSGWDEEALFDLAMAEILDAADKTLTDQERAEMLPEWQKEAREAVEEFKQFILFDEQGLPTSSLFADEPGLMMYEAKRFKSDLYALRGSRDRTEWDYDQNDLSMRFLANNLGHITEEDRGFIQEWTQLRTEESKKAFIYYVTDNFNCDAHLFDEHGKTEQFYRTALYSQIGRDALPLTDPEWQGHYSVSELAYMRFDAQLDDAHKLNLLDLNLTLTEEEKFGLFFDQHGPTPVFARSLLSSTKHHLKVVAEIPELSSLCYPAEQRYLEAARLYDYPQFMYEVRGVEIGDYFDEVGPKTSFWQLAFDAGELAILHQQSDEIRQTMQLSPKQERVLTIYGGIQDEVVALEFSKFVLEDFDNLPDEKLEILPEILAPLTHSNASEVSQHRWAIARLLLRSEDPVQALEQIETVFIRNNLPDAGKAYTVFAILHPIERLGQDFHIEYSLAISPTLKEATNLERSQIIFTDLLKCALGSNNRSMQRFLSALNENQTLVNDLASGEKSWDALSPDELAQLQKFTRKLATVYDQTTAGRSNPRDAMADMHQEFSHLMEAFRPDARHSVTDRVVHTFGYPLGIRSLEDATKYMENARSKADARNRQAAKEPFVLESGDLVKGIGGIQFLSNILQNGSVAREFLGDSAGSDLTPLDTDLSRIAELKATTQNTIRHALAGGYGPIWFVLKGDDRFKITRTEQEDTHQPEATRHLYQDDGRMELFSTGGGDHYGIRTGFASSEINAMIVDSYDPRIGLEIAKNGFYIPVIESKTDRVVFTPEDYDALIAKMSGLSYYK